MDYTNKIICFVDDDETSMKFTKIALNKSGFQNVFTFSSGADFFNFYKQNDNSPPDIVFLDVQMEPMNGFEVLETAIQNNKFSQALFVSHSSYMDKEIDKSWLGHIGFDHNLLKNFSVEKLIVTIKSLINNKEILISKRNPFGNLISTVHELSRLRLRSSILENEYIKKFISPEIFEILDTNPKELIPRYKEASIAYVDIRSFTELMNNLQIEQMTKVLEIFFSNTVECIIKENGHVDKFIGDSVMWFHASKSIEENCKDCIRAAIRISQNNKEMNNAIQNKLHVDLNLNIGIGIACGSAAVGIFGAPDYRIQYSVFGPPVNLASRLCSEAKASEILIGGAAIDYCPFDTKKIGFQTIKGFNHKVEIHSIENPLKIKL